MVKKISCVTSLCGNRCKALSTQNSCLVNIVLLVAKIIPDNWHCFSFWDQVFVSTIFSFVAHFSVLLPVTNSMCRGVICFVHWLRTNVTGGSGGLHALCVSGTLEIRWVHLPSTGQALLCDYCAHVHCDDDAQMIYRASVNKLNK